MTDFFSEFDAERWYFTFMDEDDHTLPVQQVGIVAIFHLMDAYHPHRRKGIAEAFSLFHHLYGDKLKGGYREDKRMIVRPFSKMSFEDYRDHIVGTSPMRVVEFDCMSRLSLAHVSDYSFSVYSPAGWFEQIHKTFTTVRIYLPIEEIRGEGRERFENFLLKCCALLRPLHGAAGLGIQECHNWEDYQTMEYETAWAYRGVDVCIPTGNEAWRDGYSNLNWYTFLAHHWIATWHAGRTEDHAERRTHRPSALRMGHRHPRRGLAGVGQGRNRRQARTVRKGQQRHPFTTRAGHRIPALRLHRR
ncbi:hypothetical protein CTI14_16955 [Methylobacterium radiotolerans]|nr:hypothetical protein CTI14_16955 [Methylobacterium radiotolerans]